MISHSKNPGLLREMAGGWCGAGNMQDEPETFCPTNSEEAHKKNHITGVISKGLRTQAEEASTGQRWDELSFNDNNCNRLKPIK